MDFSELLTEIKQEPEVFLPSIHDDMEQLVEITHPPVSITSNNIAGADIPPLVTVLDAFCERIEEATSSTTSDIDTQADAAPNPMEVDEVVAEKVLVAGRISVKIEEPSMEEEEADEQNNSSDRMQDSGGVFKDHNYSLFKDVNPVDQLLMTYYSSTAKDASPISECNQNVCKIVELLGTVVSTSSSDIIASTFEMIEGYTSLMRMKFNEREMRSEKVFKGNSYLTQVRELGQFLVKESNRVASLVADETEICKTKAESKELLDKLKFDVSTELSKFQVGHEKREEIGIQTEQTSTLEMSNQTEETPTMEISCQTEEKEEIATVEFSCQTDPLLVVKPMRLFSSSDIDTDSSASSSTRRKRKRRRKRELLQNFFETEGGAEVEKKKRKEKVERRVPTGTDDEIDRLININNLDRDYQDPDEQNSRGSEEKTENGPETVKSDKKATTTKKGETMEDILNGIDIQAESGEEGDGQSGSEEEAEESKFLKELNLEHKKLLLNSSTDEDSDSNYGAQLLLKTHKENVEDSGEESVIEETVDLFLTDFKEKREKMEKQKQKQNENEKAPEAPEIRHRRDSLDAEVAKMLQEIVEDSGDSDVEGEKTKKKKEPKRKADDLQEGASKMDDETSPLDLSDTAGKRSRNESMEGKSVEETEKTLGDAMMQKRKLILNSQTTETLDAMVLKVHQASRNPLLCAATTTTTPLPVPSPSPASTSRDPDYISLSSSSSLEELTDLDPATVTSGSVKAQEPWKRNTRKMMSEDKLDINTKKAQSNEQERIKRLEKKNEALKKYMAEKGKEHAGEIILDVHQKTQQLVKVHPDIVRHLKKHQVEGIRFIYDCAYGSIGDMEKHKGSGCILAHCMGLGKTLQQIAIMHTVVQYPALKTNRILVICPKSTVMNWVDEVDRWIGGIQGGVKLKVFYMPDQSDLDMRLKILHHWYQCGKPNYPAAGVMLLGHEAFRILVLKKLEEGRAKDKIVECLLDPGPDLVICDEGHVIKNPNSAISKAVSRIKTAKRVILTGTPIQNNLKEYFCMVSFIKPMFLGTLKEFSNLYANPIKCGQHKDSTHREIKVMQQRSYVLHKKLEKFVQRREAATLKQFLPEKFEYVIFVPLTPVQERLYRFFLAKNPAGEWNGKSLISDYTFLRKIWTHPKVIETAYINAITEQNKIKAREKERRRRENVESEEDDPDDVLDKRSDSLSVTNDWWRSHLSVDDLESLFPSHKLRIMFEILKLCKENGEKCLIFSAFVAVLNVVEYFMAKINCKGANSYNLGLDNFSGPWVPGVDYYRLDGRTSKQSRHAMIKRFNDPDNRTVKCFLISAKAGGMGINLTGANRVIILDTSWNPSNDQQNIFRIFRLGQKRNCYVYRLLAMGTMEEKVYSRSVTKQALSYRVVDEQAIDRHYSMAELAELYVLSMPDFNERPVPIRPSDRLLANLVHSLPNIIFKYHVHDSLLENKADQHLSEEDKREAWAEYEQQENRQAGMELNPLGSLDGLANLTQSLAQMGYNMGGTNSNALLSLLNQYPGIATDPYFPLMYASSGLTGPPPPPSGYPSMLTGGNRYFTSGTLFPPDGSGSAAAAARSSPSTKKGNESAARVRMMPPQNPAIPSTSTGRSVDNFPGLTAQQLTAFDPSSLFWSLAQAGGAGPSGYGLMGAMGSQPSNGPPPAILRQSKGQGSNRNHINSLSPGLLGPPYLNAGLSPGVERNLQLMANPMPPLAGMPGLGQGQGQERRREEPKKRAPQKPTLPPYAAIIPTNVFMPPSSMVTSSMSTPVSSRDAPVLPSSTTIKKLPLSTNPAPSVNDKAPILPAVPQSITVEKVTPSLLKLTSLQKQRSSLVDKGKSLQPTAVIDLIDDVIDANPGLTVKPVMRPGGQGAAAQQQQQQQGVKMKTISKIGAPVKGGIVAMVGKSSDNFGITYPTGNAKANAIRAAGDGPGVNVNKPKAAAVPVITSARSVPAIISKTPTTPTPIKYVITPRSPVAGSTVTAGQQGRNSTPQPIRTVTGPTIRPVTGPPIRPVAGVTVKPATTTNSPVNMNQPPANVRIRSQPTSTPPRAQETAVKLPAPPQPRPVQGVIKSQPLKLLTSSSQIRITPANPTIVAKAKEGMRGSVNNVSVIPPIKPSMVQMPPKAKSMIETMRVGTAMNPGQAQSTSPKTVLSGQQKQNQQPPPSRKLVVSLSQANAAPAKTVLSSTTASQQPKKVTILRNGTPVKPGTVLATSFLGTPKAGPGNAKESTPSPITKGPIRLTASGSNAVGVKQATTSSSSQPSSSSQGSSAANSPSTHFLLKSSQSAAPAGTTKVTANVPRVVVRRLNTEMVSPSQNKSFTGKVVTIGATPAKTTNIPSTPTPIAGQKRPASITSAGSEQPTKKIILSGTTADNSSAKVQIVRPPNLTVIQKNLQKRQNSSLS